MEIFRSKSGIPCLTECGGGCTNTGTARIVADKNGYPKPAIHVFDRGNLCCGDHAVIPVTVGDVVITAYRHRDKVSITVERITSTEDDIAHTVPATEPICWSAVEAAIDKSNNYHCRKPYYIRGL